jgi:hypothetical protein
VLSSARDVADHAPVRGDEAVTTRLLIAAHGLRPDPLFVEAALRRAADAADLARDCSDTADALDAASTVLPGPAAMAIDPQRADGLADRLLAAQNANGWWVDGETTPTAALQARVLIALLRYHRSHPAPVKRVERALYRGARAAWTEMFEPTGRAWSTIQRASPMDVDDVARFVLVFGDVAGWPKREAYGRYAQATLRQLLHRNRTAAGGLARPPESVRGERVGAMAFWILAELAEDHPGWLS